MKIICATNRINTPQVAEEILASNKADLISMARPFLADEAFVSKARSGKVCFMLFFFFVSFSFLPFFFRRSTFASLAIRRAWITPFRKRELRVW